MRRSCQPAEADLQAGHTHAAIAARLSRQPGKSYLRDFVYGAIDGTVTTFATTTFDVASPIQVVVPPTSPSGP